MIIEGIVTNEKCSNPLVLELSDYSIQDIAQTVRSTLEPLAADKKLGFKVEVAPQLPSGRGDGRRLTQVDELVETVALAVYMGGGPAAVYGAEAVRAYDQFSGKS